MLLQLTNRCTENCPHCLQNSLADAQDMTDEVFEASLRFIKYANPRVLLVSGGEPFMRKDILRICQRLDKEGIFFVICTNGVAICSEDNAKYKYTRIKELRHCLGVQVYSHKDFYQHYDIVKSKSYMFGKEFVDTPILSMQDLGRAKTSAKAQEYINNHKFHCSCLNTYLISRQVTTFTSLLRAMEGRGQFCHPLIDFRGNIHASESNLCQSCGTVYDRTETVFNNLAKQAPCHSCKLGQRFWQSEQPEIVQARTIIERTLK